MPHSYGTRARTRDMFAKRLGTRGNPSLRTYIRTFKVGDHVDVVADPGVQKGMPYKFYQGRTGRVWNVTPRAVGVLVNKVVGNRVIRKKISVRTEHVRKSGCQGDFKQRVAHNEQIKRKEKEGKRIKRQPAGPKAEMIVKCRAYPRHLGPVKYNFADQFNY